MVQQLTLNLSLRSDFTFDNFQVGANQQLLASLKQLAHNQGETCTYIWGQAGSGRSHLLQAVAQASHALGRTAFYLPLQAITDLSPAICQDLEQLSLICLDDIACLAEQPQWQEAIFHLYNRVQANNGHLLVSANCPPVQLCSILADLVTRLGAGLVYHLHELSEADKLLVLMRQAKQRGLNMSHEVAAFVLRRTPRDLASLLAVLEQLDHASLAYQRKLTIPFVKQTLGL